MKTADGCLGIILFLKLAFWCGGHGPEVSWRACVILSSTITVLSILFQAAQPVLYSLQMYHRYWTDYWKTVDEQEAAARGEGVPSGYVASSIGAVVCQANGSAAPNVANMRNQQPRRTEKARDGAGSGAHEVDASPRASSTSSNGALARSGSSSAQKPSGE